MEKDQFDSPALVALETCSERVIRDDWRLYIDLEVATDLRKYRSYRGNSVRDLLRALRNKVSEKKHECISKNTNTMQIKNSLGDKNNCNLQT